jgi:hypothetical protein
MLDQLFSGNTLFFSIPAVAGTLFFTFRLILMFAGMSHMDVNSDGLDGLDPMAGDAHHSTEMFKFLSIQSIAAFVMGFGWGGLGGLLGAGWDWSTSLLAALVGGIGMVWLLSWLLKLVYDLQSSGNISIETANGAEGEVYAGVPAKGNGTGQVRVVIGERQRIYNAVSEDEPLPTKTRVRVIRVNADRTLTVMRA